jgi:hypothetical protein
MFLDSVWQCCATYEVDELSVLDSADYRPTRTGQAVEGQPAKNVALLASHEPHFGVGGGEGHR